MGNLLVFQSGGPTAALNASLTGIIRAARNRFGAVYGSRRGLQGALSGELRELSTLPDAALERLRNTPSAALGTSRFRPDNEQLDAILDRLAELDVSGVIAIGGNDTADTAARLERRARERDRQLAVIGIPKTIDNDLALTDHCLGYPSAARCLAAITRDATVDSLATATLYPVKVIEVMGRNAGWLAAACSLAIPDGLPQPLTVLPERPFASPDDLCAAISQRVERDGFALVIVPETARWADGTAFGGVEPEYVDAFGHPYYPSSGQAVVRLVSGKFGSRARLDRPGTFTRSAMDYASQIDLDEAERCGGAAVEAIECGESGKCVIIERRSSAPYQSCTSLAPLTAIANVERTIPEEMLAQPGDPPGAAFFDYALPLVGEIDREYEILEW